MEIKITILVTLVLCVLNSSFFLVYDGGKEYVDRNTNQEQRIPIFYINQDKQVKVVKVQAEVEEVIEGAEEQDESYSAPVRNYNTNPPVSYQPTPPPNEGEEVTQEPDPTPPVTEPEDPPEDPEPIGGGPDPFGDIGGGID